MRPEIAKYLQDVRQACQLLRTFVHGKSFVENQNDSLLRAGVEREFITIGEALLQAQQLDTSLGQEKTELRRIVSVRNVLVHGYASINDLTVWGVVQKNLPLLEREVEAILLSLGGP